MDKTLKALIEAEREVGEQLALARDEKRESNVTLADIEDWAKAFCAYLNKSIAEVSVPVPNLALIVSVSERSEPITILVKDGNVTLSAHKGDDLPFCSLLLTERAAVSALQSSDVQALLDSICKGTCVLKGQTEPFIWFIGRVIEQRQAVDTDILSEVAMG